MNEAIRKAAEQGSGAVVCPRCKARIERASASVKRMARNGQDLEDFGGILDPAGWPFNEGPGPLVFHPLPVPARCCGTILQATYADQNDYRCPQCRALVCYTCGCTEASACDLKIVTEATGHVTHLVCA